MKKAHMLTLALMMAITLAACGGGSRTPGGDAGGNGAPPVSPDDTWLPLSGSATGDGHDGASSNSPQANTSISVYNAGGYLINTVSRSDDADALRSMLTDAPVYSGPDLHLSNAPYRLNMRGDSAASCDLWLRNNRIYFKTAGAATVYAPENMDAAEFKRIINDK